jgi:CRISPR-associated protein Cmx8
MIDDYTRIKGSLWNPLFRKRRLLNLVNRRTWQAGFDEILCAMPYEHSIGNKGFRHDARESFRQEVQLIEEEARANMSDDSTLGALPVSPTASSLSCEALVYRVVGFYLQSKLKSKYQLEWSVVKENAAGSAQYQEMKEKIARDAFLAVRSRSGVDFADYFASTLCSVSQPLSEQQYIGLAQALYEDTEKVRTLTMLALSARG